MRMTVMLLVAGCASAASEPPAEAPKPDAPAPQPKPSAEPAGCDNSALDKASPQHTAEGLLAAATCYRDAGDVGREIVALRALVEGFPDDPRSKEALRAAGQAYERIGHAADAARVYELYARRYGAEADAADLLKRATCLRRGFGDERAAEQNFEELRRRHRVTATLDEICPKRAP